ncbi:MAG: FtsX-like permease family protein [Nannocystaceae bacterium]
MGSLGTRSLEWRIAWRHLGVGELRPRWTAIVVAVSIFLLLLGAGFGTYASYALAPPNTGLDALSPDLVLGVSSGAQLQRSYGVFAAISIFAGAMLLLFGGLCRYFNLLSSIITFSVLLGCMALVLVLSLMSGLEGDLRDKILAQRAHIRVARVDGDRFANYHELVAEIASASGVAGASPYIEGEVMVRSGTNRQGATLIGVIPERLMSVSNLPDIIREGDFGSLADPSLLEAHVRADTRRPNRPWRLRHLEPSKKTPPGAIASAPSPSPSESSPSSSRSAPVKPAIAAAEASPIRSLSGISPRSLPVLPAVVPTKAEDGVWEDPVVEFVSPNVAPSGKFSRLSAREPVREPSREIDVSGAGWENPAIVLGLAPDDPDAATGGPTPRPVPQLGNVAQIEIGGSKADIHPILIGRELAMEIAVQVGAPVQLITPIGRMTPAGRVPGVLATRTGGVFFSGMYEYDRKNVYITLPTAQAFLLTGDRITGIEIKLDDVSELAAGKRVVARVVADLGRDGDLVVETWQDLNRNLFSAMLLEKIAMFVALLFVVLVASFGILASNLMSVLEKAQEIAILKAMGCRDLQIRNVFVREGLCVGLLGAFFGICVGLGICQALERYGFPLNENLYYNERLPVAVDPMEVTIVGCAALVIVWASSLYPAYVASRIRPVDGLRQLE